MSINNRHALVLSISLIVLIGFGCKNERQIEKNNVASEAFENYSVDLSYTDNHFFGIISEVEIIPLEETKESLLSDIFDIKFNGSFLYLTSWKRKHIYKFTWEGKFINVLDKYGDGPDEYSFIGNIDFLGDTMLLLDRNRQRMTYWDENFVFLKGQRIGFPSHSFVKTESGFLFDNYYQQVGDSLMANGIYSDGSFNVISALIPFERLYHSIPSTNQFQRVNGVYNYRPPYDNILYKITDNGEVQNEVTFDFGDYWFFNESRSLEEIRNVYSQKEPLDSEFIAYLNIYESKNAFILVSTIVPDYRAVLSYVDKDNEVYENINLRIDDYPQNNIRLLDVDYEGVVTISLGQDQLKYLLEYIPKSSVKILGGKSIEDLINMENPVILRCKLNIDF